MDEASDAFLSFFKFEWLLLASMLIIDEQWLDKLNQLVDRASRLDLLVVLYDSLANAQSYSSLVLELHVVH